VSDIHLKELNNAKEGGLTDGFYNLLKKIPFEYISISTDGSPEFSKQPVSKLKNTYNSDNSFSMIEEKFSLLLQRFFDKKPTVSFSSLFSNLKIDPKVFSEPDDDPFKKVLIQAAFNHVYESKTNECLKKNNHPPINFSVFLESAMGPHRFNNIYNIILLLNFLSYSRDKRMNKFDKFQGSQNDAMHLIYASYCSSFITIDFRLYKKAVVTYEFLKITTRLEYLKMKGKMIERKTAYQFSNPSP
jgi:hypothetical protein